MMRFNQNNNRKNKIMLRALVLTAILFTLSTACLLWIYARSKPKTGLSTAYIYQNSKLIDTIDLSAVTTPYSITVTTQEGGYNMIEVLPGSIGIRDANCPDKLCVHMGFTDTNASLLPIICLPHNLIIEIVQTDDVVPDIISY